MQRGSRQSRHDRGGDDCLRDDDRGGGVDQAEYPLRWPPLSHRKKKEEVKGDLKDSYRSTEAKQKLLQNVMTNQVDATKKDLSRELQFAKKDLQSNDKNK